LWPCLYIFVHFAREDALFEDSLMNFDSFLMFCVEYFKRFNLLSDISDLEVNEEYLALNEIPDLLYRLDDW
jgi:hypothetical protein